MPESMPLDREQISRWQRRIERARDLRDRRMDVWKECVQAYLGKPLVKTPDHDVVIVNKEFPFLEQKKAQLVFQVPEVQLKPKLPGLEQATQLFQAALNHEMGVDGANVKDTLDEVLFDVLAMGIGVSKIGYAASIGERKVTQPDMDPLTGQPAVGPDGQPQTITRTLPYLADEEYFWKRISPAKCLVPAEFEGMNFDDAPWLGFEFEKDWEFAKRDYNLPDDFKASRSADPKADLSGEKEGLNEDATLERVRGIEIWYYASRFDPAEVDPNKVRVLVFVDGKDVPVRHQDSPYQRLNQAQQLIGMHGLPIHMLTLRGVSGSAYPPSDIELSKHISDELSKGRTQMVLQRETSIPMRWADKARLDPDTVNKLLRGSWQAVIPVDGNGMEIIGEVARANFPRENFTFNEICDRDYEEMWALGRNQRGLTEDAMRTATELQMAQGAASVRLDAERGRVLTFFTRGARKFGALLQLFKTDQSYVEILGSQAQGLQAWNRDLIQGEFLFQAKPDSALRMDAAVERKQVLDVYNLLARDPNVARTELLKTLLQKFNLDASRIVVDTPPQGPEPPKVSLTIRGEDLAMPSPLLLEVLRQYGIQVTPQLQQAMAAHQQVMQTMAPAPGTTPPVAPHGGPAEQAQPLAKHNLRGDGTTPLGVMKKPGTVQ